MRFENTPFNGPTINPFKYYFLQDRIVKSDFLILLLIEFEMNTADIFADSSLKFRILSNV